MIRNLHPETICRFGVIRHRADGQTQGTGTVNVTLKPGVTRVYQTVTETWLNAESGMIVLSLAEQNAQYQDYYLDKPVVLRPGIWFSLSALDESACALINAETAPRFVEERPAANEFFVRPALRIESLCTLFYQEREQGFLFAGEAHPMLELTYVDQGSLHSVVDGQDLLLEQGDMMLYGPGQWHMQYADIGVAPRFVTISFTMEQDLPELYSRKFRSPQKAIDLLQQILREQELGQPDAEDSIISLLTLLLIALRREKGRSSKLQLSNSSNNENTIIRSAQQFIAGHVHDKLSVPMVAKGVDVSPSYLTALFHKHLQISPGEYIRRIKLQLSKQMIREGNMNFTEIASALQYSTVHHFSRQFKEKFGLTPTEYARSVR